MSKHSFLCVIALLALQIGWAGENQRLLLSTQPGSSIESIKRSIPPLGKVVGKNIDGFLIVELRPGLSVEDGMVMLQPIPGVASVHRMTAAAYQSNDLPSLDAHMDYVRAKNAHHGVTAKVPGYMEALREYMRARVGPNGRVDGDALREGLEHRDQMPSSPPPTSISAAPPGSIDVETIRGGWSYVGPRNIAAPTPGYFGPRPVAGRVNGIAVHFSMPNRIFVASPRGGVFRSTNGGVSWEGLSSTWTSMETSCVAIDPTNADTIYVGTGDHHGGSLYGIGVMKSTDGGTTWTNYGRSQMQGSSVSKILINPSNTSQIVATTGGGLDKVGLVYRSIDAGQTWTPCVDTNGVQLPELDWCDGDYSAPVFLGSTSRNLYVVAGETPGGAMFRSTNWGASWSRVLSPVPGFELTKMDCAAGKSSLRPNEVYLMTNNAKKIWRSDTRGAAWVDITAGLPSDGLGKPEYNWSQFGYDYHLSTALTDDGITIVYAGLITLSANIGGLANAWYDIGETWQATARTHNDQHTLFVDPTTSEQAWVGNDGGVYRVALNVPPGGGAPTPVFTNFNLQLPITQFYALALHPTDTSRVMGGTQDNATPMSLGDLLNWSNLGQGDGGMADFVRPDPNKVYISWQGGAVGESRDGFATLGSNITPDYGSDHRPFVTALRTATGTRSHDVLVGTNYLWRFNSITSTWHPRIGGTELADVGSRVTSISMARTNQNRIYTGTGDGKVWMTTDYAATPWVRIDQGIPDRWIADVVCKDGASNDVLVALSGFEWDNLWRCSNTDAGTRVWQDVTGAGAGNLPRTPINAIAIDPFDTNTWYVGTDIGMFMTTNAGGFWTNITNSWGLPNVHVTDLKVFNSGGNAFLYAATFGRGIWRVRLKENALNSLSLPVSVFGGDSVSGTLYFNGPVDRAILEFESSDPFIAWAPPVANVVNSSEAGFLLRTNPVMGDMPVTISSSYGGVTKSDTITVRRATLKSLTFNVTRHVGGYPFTGKVALNGGAPGSGFFVFLEDTFTELYGYPSSVMLDYGTREKSFTVKSNPVTADKFVSIKATASGVTKTAAVVLTPGGLTSVKSIVASVTGGNSFQGQVILTGPVPGDTVVTLTSLSAHLSLPATVVVPGGSVSALFNITTTAVSNNTTAQFEGTAGNTTRRGTVTLTP